MAKFHGHKADLPGALLVFAPLKGTDLEEAHLQHANLAGTNLTEAHLFGANLQRVNLAGANLAGADLMAAVDNPEELPLPEFARRMDQAIRIARSQEIRRTYRAKEQEAAAAAAP